MIAAAAHQPTKMVVQDTCTSVTWYCVGLLSVWKSIGAVVFVTTTVTIEMIHERQQLAAQSSILQLTAADPDRPLYRHTGDIDWAAACDIVGRRMRRVGTRVSLAPIDQCAPCTLRRREN